MLGAGADTCQEGIPLGLVGVRCSAEDKQAPAVEACHLHALNYLAVGDFATHYAVERRTGTTGERPDMKHITPFDGI